LCDQSGSCPNYFKEQTGRFYNQIAEAKMEEIKPALLFAFEFDD
jgi:hypothetical protein